MSYLRRMLRSWVRSLPLAGSLAIFAVMGGMSPCWGQGLQVHALTGEPIPGTVGGTYGSLSSFNTPLITNAGEAFWIGNLPDSTRYVGHSTAGVILQAGQTISPGVEVDLIFDINTSKHASDTVVQVQLTGANVTPGVDDLAILRSSADDNWVWSEALRKGDTRGGDTIDTLATPITMGAALAINGMATGPGGTTPYVYLPATATTPERYISSNSPATSNGGVGFGVFFSLAFLGKEFFFSDDPDPPSVLLQSQNAAQTETNIEALNLATGNSTPVVSTGDATTTPGTNVGDFVVQTTIDSTYRQLGFYSSNSTNDERFVGGVRLGRAEIGVLAAETATAERITNVSFSGEHYVVQVEKLDSQGLVVSRELRYYDHDDPQFQGNPSVEVLTADGDTIGGAELKLPAGLPTVLTNRVGQAIVPAFDTTTTNPHTFQFNKTLFTFDHQFRGGVRIAEGDTIDVRNDPQSPDLRTIRSFGFTESGNGEGGHGASFNDFGQIALPVFFTDFTSALLVLDTWQSELPGDYNNDGVVDLADYTMFRDALGEDATALPHNNIDPGPIGEDHFNTWLTYYGMNSPTLGAAAQQAQVPEPGAIIQLVGVLLGLATLLHRTKNG